MLERAGTFGQCSLGLAQDLFHDATRDLRALGCHISLINNCQTLDKETRVSGLAKDMQEGVLFMCAPPGCFP